MAGACNAVLGRKFLRSEDSPLSHLEIAALLHGMLSEQAAKRHASVARLLGVSSLEPAFDALRADLAAEGRSLGGRKELGCKPKEAFTRLRLICEERVRSREEEDARTAAGVSVWSALLDVLPVPAAAPAAAPASAPAAAEEEEEDDDDEAAMLGGGAPVGAADNFGVKVRKELKALLNKLSGCEQLAPSQPRLLTTMIGNWGIRGAIKELSEGSYSESTDPRLAQLQRQLQQAEVASAPSAAPSEAAGDADANATSLLPERAETEGCDTEGGKENAPAQPAGAPATCGEGVGVAGGHDGVVEEGGRLAERARELSSLRVRTLCSVRVKGLPAPPIVLRASDSEAEMASEWQSLKAAFGRENTALILHHKNHYSLIFAMREWVEPDGTAIREMLTARKGQRPTAWISFAEIHGLLSRWAGYAFMEVSKEAEA